RAKVTRHPLMGGGLWRWRLDLGALGHDEGAARMEAAARWGIAGRRDFPRENHLLSHNVRVSREGSREERLGVGVRWILEQLFCLGTLDDLAQVHDRHLAERV